MVNLLKFDASDPKELSRQGFSHRAVSEIILGPDDIDAPRIRADCPPWARSFIVREYRASELTFRSMRQPSMLAPHPRTGDPVQLSYAFVSPVGHDMTSVVFKVFGDEEEKFCLVFGALTSRVTHIIVPDSQSVVYDLD